MKKLAATGDYAIAAPYAVTAGSGTGESVELDVTGKLTVGGSGLTVTGTANTATVKAGILVASSLALTGSNAAAP